MRNSLTVKRVNFLSLVDRPANQHAVAVIAKRASVGDNMRRRFGELFKRFLDGINPAAGAAGGTSAAAIAKDAVSFNQMAATDRLWTLGSSLQSSIASILADDVDPAAKGKMIDASLSEFRDAVLALNTDDPAFQAIAAAAEATVTKGTCPECGADLGDGTGTMKAAHTAACSKYVAPVTKTEPTPQPPAAANTSQPVEGITMKTVPTFTDLAAAQQHIGVITKELNDATTELETVRAEKDPIAAITKGMAPAAAAHYRKLHDDNAALQKRELDRERSARVTKVAGETTALTADESTAMSTILKGLDGVSVTPEERTAAETFLTGMFKQYNAMADELESMGEVGLVAGGEPSGDAELETVVAQKVIEVRKRAGNEKLSDVAARAIVWTENPDLYEQHSSAEPVPA